MSFNKILPIQDLGLAPSIPPEHPFVRTASLYYLACVRDSDPLFMTDQLRRSIYTFTTEQVCLALQCPPTLDVVLAMLILSYASVRQVEDATGFADPFRAAALGLDMAIELGLDDTAEKLRSAEAAELLMFDASILRKACLVSLSSRCLVYLGSNVGLIRDQSLSQRTHTVVCYLQPACFVRTFLPLGL